MNKYISKILIVVGGIALSFIVLNNAMAAYPTIQDCANSTWTTPVGCDAIMDRYYAGYYSNGYDYVSTTRSNTYSNQPNQYYQYPQPIAYVNPAPLTTTPIVNNYYYKDESVANKSTTSTNTKTVTSGSTSVKNSNSNSDVDKVNSDSKTADSEDVFSTDGSNNGLTALSFRGDGGFLPSSFWQWLLVIFLILIIVIIARMIARSHRNDIHGAPAH